MLALCCVYLRSSVATISSPRNCGSAHDHSKRHPPNPTPRPAFGVQAGRGLRSKRGPPSCLACGDSRKQQTRCPCLLTQTCLLAPLQRATGPAYRSPTSPPRQRSEFKLQLDIIPAFTFAHPERRRAGRDPPLMPGPPSNRPAGPLFARLRALPASAFTILQRRTAQPAEIRRTSPVRGGMI